jgi:hypothetical protein
MIVSEHILCLRVMVGRQVGSVGDKIFNVSSTVCSVLRLNTCKVIKVRNISIYLGNFIGERLSILPAGILRGGIPAPWSTTTGILQIHHSKSILCSSHGASSHPSARRAMFESDFPVDKGSCGDAALWNAFKRIASGYSAAEKAALFAGTARKFYQLVLAKHCQGWSNPTSSGRALKI